MAAPPEVKKKSRQNSHYTPTTHPYLQRHRLLLSLTLTLTFMTKSDSLTTNITTLLTDPDFSTFSSLLTTSSPYLTPDLSTRSSLTLLAVPNSFLSPSSLDLTRRLSPSSLADLLRYHFLLQFLSPSDLTRLPTSGSLVATLFQTTGRASSNFGSVNVSRNPDTNAVTVHSPAPYSPSNATVLGIVKSFPYNLTILSVSSLLVPYGFDIMESESRPPLGLNITNALLNGHQFYVAASMLSASGVVEEFEADEGGAGITLFVPTDAAFSDLPPSVRFQSLPAEQKAVILKFHVLHSYYPLGSLESIVNPVQPTLATEDMGAGRYTLNISRVNGSVSINSGIVQATVTQTVFDQNPVAIFGVSKVLLPREIFGSGSGSTSGSGTNKPVVMGDASPPDILAEPPESSPEGSPGVREEIRSDGGKGRCIGTVQALVLGICCIGLYLVV